MKKYVIDMRPALIRLENNRNELLEMGLDEFLTEKEKSNPRKLFLEDEHYSNIVYEALEVGQHLYCVDSEENGQPTYEIEITHLYGGVMFFKWLEGSHKGQEDYYGKRSFAFLKMCYAFEAVIKSGWELSTTDSRTSVVVDDDMATIGTYAYTYNLNRERDC